MSSLAAQLAQSASLNTALLVDRSRRKATESYLFTGREADQHDLESIHALGVNGLLQLVSLQPTLRKLTETLFSAHAKITDRTLLSLEANAELNASIARCLTLLGPYLMETPTGKILEWLVRRFRINEFNVDAVLALFLPYHESPHFTKMLSILHIKPNSTWSFLLPFKSAAQNLPRVSLVIEMLRNTDVSRFVTSLLPIAIKGGYSHRVLIAFNAACLHDFLSRSSQLDEGTVAYILPAFLEPLKQGSVNKDAVLGSYVLLSAFSQKCKFTPAALNVVLSAMAGSADQVSAKHFTNAALSVCEPQAELDHYSNAALKAILRIPDIENELRTACAWIGVEKLLNPLLPGLIRRLSDERALHLFEAIMTTPKAPLSVIQKGAVLLLDVFLGADAPAPPVRSLLAAIQQRSPVAFHQAIDEVGQREERDKEVLEQLQISLSVVPGSCQKGGDGDNDTIDMVLASTNPDTKVRTVAVNHLLGILSRKETPSESGKKSIHAALLARVQDTHQAIIDALYHEPSVILPVLNDDPETYLENLCAVLSAPGSKPKRTLSRAHLTFLRSHFIPANPDHSEPVFQRIFFPFILFSKPRQHTTEVVWDIIASPLQTSQQNAGLHEWLIGCAPIVKLEKEENAGSDGIEMMSRLNRNLSSQIARNILRSNDYSVHFDALLAKLQDPHPHVKVLGYLIMRSLLGQLSGEHQVGAARRVLDLKSFEDLKNVEELLSGDETLLEAVDVGALGKTVVARPSSNTTVYWLQIAILCLVSSIPRPAGLFLNWLVDSSSASPETRGVRYVELFRTIYRIANLPTSYPLLSTSILQTLFLSLRDDLLAFLAGIWVGSTEAVGEDELRTVALFHAAAFLQAHAVENGSIDFQTILPSLLIALQSQDSDRRQITLICISHLRQLVDHKFTTVYGFDTIYGNNTSQLQYLDQDDFKKYLNGLMDHQDHFLHDTEYIKVFHQQHLGRSKLDKKRDYEYKHRVLCFLLSHVNALTLPTAQAALLGTINTIADDAKVQILLPTIRTLFSYSNDALNGATQDLIILIISCFDVSVAKDLNDANGEVWSVYVSMLKCAFESEASRILSLIVSRALEQGLFSALESGRKIELLELLLEFGTQNADNYMICKQLLGNLIDEIPLIVHILDSLQPATASNPPRATKRPKITYVSEEVPPRLNLFAEVLASKQLPPSLELVSNLLETLNRISQSVSAAQVDTSYVAQLLMSAIENAANKISRAPNLSPSAIRLDILVELIRVSDNPQTFHQALLLMADLSRLAPESALHNVMPVFTFMGANIFHRDDTYSFKVVRRTIESIVPVMVGSLKRAHSQSLDLYAGSKDFLKVFTDAANHIPRHRRTNFFSHLLEALGPEDFLSPICMLLVEKAANRLIRQNLDEAQNYISLPCSILQHFSTLQTRTLTDILMESERLVQRVAYPESNQPVFLDASDEETMATRTIILRRRAQALVVFVGYALKPRVPEITSRETHEKEMGQLVSALISLTHSHGSAAEGKVDEIALAACSSMNRALGVMLASDFINAVLLMVQSADPLIQSGALDLLSERLSNVAAKNRQDAVPVMTKIIGVIRDILRSRTNPNATSSAFSALRAISLTLCAGEESSVVETIPLLLSAVEGRTLAAPAMAALSPLSTKLGPRAIPYFRDMISYSVIMIRQGNPAILENAYSVLRGLLASIPTFWGSGELKQVMMLFVEKYISSSDASLVPLSSLIKTVAKKVPSKVLLPAIIDMWPSIHTPFQPNRFVAYFEVLAKVLRNAARSTVLEHLRSLFKLFLESFEMDASSANDAGAESRAIAAFKELVVKLNDAAFRPLFRRLYDWAFANETDDNGKKTTFCHMYIALLEFFKGLMNPYMSFLLEPFIMTLDTFSSRLSDDLAYWMGIVETITKSLTYDDGSFWRDDKLRQLALPLVKQVPICVKLDSMEGKSSLQNCLDALVDSATDDMVLKAINLELLMHTRSEDVRLRLFALICAEKLWSTHGNKLLGFAGETTTFIAECSEDENDMVVRVSLKLKDAVESVAGNINGL